MRNSGDRSATTSFTSADPLCQIRCLSERVQSTNASVNNAGASSNISATNCLAAYSDNFTKDAIEDEDESVYFTPGHKDSIPMNKHLTLKPVIRELVRTKVCFQDIKLLVDKISIVKLSTKENSTANEAYRLFLTDRESTIQALVKRRLHKFINRSEIREGSYVVLKDYKLATGKRLNGEGEIKYLAVSDFYSIGEEERIEAESSGSVPPSPPPQSLGKKRTRSTESAAGESDDDAPASKVAKTDGDTSLNAEATRDWLVTAAAKHHKNCHDASHDAGHTACHSFTAYAEKAIRAGKPLRPVSRPLRLSTLASVTGVNASRNKTVDILALLDSVDDHTIKRKDIPLYRDIHIIDPSTERNVILSVFIDPVDFVPNKGDIALFRSVTTHEYKGGKLNAYPQHCEGKDWYIPDPICIKGCETELKAMQDFKKQYERKD